MGAGPSQPKGTTPVGRPDDGGGDFSGIDPQALWDLINSMDSRTGRDGNGSACPQVSDWMGQANRIGLDTSRLSTIFKHFTWAQDQLPMLRRRHSLAASESTADGEFGWTGMVGAGAGDLGAFATQQAAAAAGKSAAQQFKDGKISVQDYIKDLQDNEFDPDYATAAANELGQSRLLELEQDSGELDAGDNSQSGRYVMANFLATAMRGGSTFKDEYGNENIQLLANVVNYATFPSDVLANLGEQSLAPGNTMYSDQVWKALGSDSKAATQFVHDNVDMLPYFMQSDSEHTGGLVDPYVKDFAAVIRAGTIPGPGADPDMAADNTTKLATYYASHQDDHTHAEIQQVFADDVTFYWGDVQSSLTDPAPVNLGPGHVNLTGAQWGGFVHESMQDPKATAALLSYSKEMSNQLADSDPDNPELQHAAGLLDGAFAFEATTVYQEKKAAGDKDAEDWQDTVSDQLSTAIETGVEIAFDPGETVKTISKAAISDVLTSFTGDMVKKDPDDVGDPPDTTTWRDIWTEAAHQSYAKNQQLGDPGQYAAMYANGKPFLTADGHLVDNATAGQQQAYNEWLKDPAVARALNDYFMQRDHGRLTSQTGVN